MGDRRLEPVGVDDPGVGEHHPVLEGEERQGAVEHVVVERGRPAATWSCTIRRPTLGIHRLVHRLAATTLQDAHERTAAAQPHAPGRYQVDVTVTTASGDRRVDRIEGGLPRPASWHAVLVHALIRHG